MVKNFGKSQRQLEEAAKKAEREGNKGEARRIRGIINYRKNRREQSLRDAAKNEWNPNNYNSNGPN